MTEGNYTDILKTSWDNLPKPVLLPNGSWLMAGRNAAYIPKKDGSDLSARVLFFYKAKEPMDDVSAVELEALGEYDFAINDLVFTVYIESNADWQRKVRPHLEKHAGWTPGADPQEGLKNFKSSEVVAYMGEKSFTDRSGETQVDNTLSNFVKPE